MAVPNHSLPALSSVMGCMNKWARFFEETMDLETYIHFDKGDISTQYSALVSKVLRSKNSTVKFPINEPSEGLKKSQIDEYLEANRSPGVQHVAIQTDDILATIDTMSRNGVTFIPTPYFHQNVDSDEVLYYVEGNFMSRKGIESGSITLHPGDVPHGPQPGKIEASIGKKDCDEYAVMVDTFNFPSHSPFQSRYRTIRPSRQILLAKRGQSDLARPHPETREF